MTHRQLRRSAIALAAMLALPSMAPLACAVPKKLNVTTTDRERISRLEEARARGLAEALLAESASERAVVSSLFSSPPQPVGVLPNGNYRCRTIKLGGILPLTVYGYFACTVSENGTRIEKTSGSQRFTGTLAPTGDALFYVGALHYNDDPASSYGQDADFDQVGCLYRIGGETERYRLELPLPQFESTHDVIELVPAH